MNVFGLWDTLLQKTLPTSIAFASLATGAIHMRGVRGRVLHGT